MANSIAMTGGDGPYSYFRNSNIQAKGSEQAKLLLVSVIEELLELQKDSQTFSIADLGCSVGPNTFSCVKTIIEAVQTKYRTCGHELNLPEFHVFFNDLISNDFNTLFKALPPGRQYLAAGVPGSFHGQLFPKSSINLMHSAFSLQWLTQVPEEVTKGDSPLWNKGRITYALSSSQIAEAFRAQFVRDMEAFFNARSVELAPGGLLVIFMPCRPEGTLPSDCFVLHHFECVGDALADMVKEGLISESLADSFNVPFFFPTASEMNQLVSSNKHLRTERLEIFRRAPNFCTPEDIEAYKLHVRGILGDILSKHFSPSLTDELFNRFPEKLKKFSPSPLHNRIGTKERLFLVVKHNHTS